MTAYQGGKQQLGKHIYNVIFETERKIYGEEKLDYFEPFIGMAGVMIHFAKDLEKHKHCSDIEKQNIYNRKLYGCDINKDIIYLWRALQRGWKPPSDCSKEEYDRLKTQKDIPR